MASIILSSHVPFMGNLMPAWLSKDWISSTSGRAFLGSGPRFGRGFWPTGADNCTSLMAASSWLELRVIATPSRSIDSYDKKDLACVLGPWRRAFCHTTDGLGHGG